MHGIQKICAYSYTESQLCSECQRPQNGEYGTSRNVAALALVRDGILKNSPFTIVGGRWINLGRKFSKYFCINIKYIQKSWGEGVCVWKMKLFLCLGMMISPETFRTGWMESGFKPPFIFPKLGTSALKLSLKQFCCCQLRPAGTWESQWCEGYISLNTHSRGGLLLLCHLP